MSEVVSTRRVSTGACALCGGVLRKSVMTGHLKACQRRAEARGGSVTRGPKGGKVYHLVVEGRWAPEYWLHLDVTGKATLADLDRFLRRIWLECCGHLSAFSINGVSYSSNPEPMFGFGQVDRGMKVGLYSVLCPGLKFNYEYDFGSTTDLKLRVIGERDGDVPGKLIQVLARNDAPPRFCVACGKPATSVCTECAWSEDGGWLCGDCLREHACGEEMALPVVNSPRVGVCGYTGS